MRFFAAALALLALAFSVLASPTMDSADRKKPKMPIISLVEHTILPDGRNVSWECKHRSQGGDTNRWTNHKFTDYALGGLDWNVTEAALWKAARLSGAKEWKWRNGTYFNGTASNHTYSNHTYFVAQFKLHVVKCGKLQNNVGKLLGLWHKSHTPMTRTLFQCPIAEDEDFDQGIRSFNGSVQDREPLVYGE